MDELRLEVREFVHPGRWRWVLTTRAGEFLADHDVRLDTASWEFEALTGMPEYLHWHVAPDRWLEQEAEIVARIGEWMGRQVFGAVGHEMARHRPATVRVVIPDDEPEAAGLRFLPFELARVGGQPLPALRVSLVTQGANEGSVRAVAPLDKRLRVLGLFSMPVGGRPLNLRRERRALTGLFSELGSAGRHVDMRVLQYGVTRERLRDVLEEAEGWDIIHISGHGAPGELQFETEDGSPDSVSAAELVGLLDLARERLKLVTVSACWSAAHAPPGTERPRPSPVPDGPGHDGTPEPKGHPAASLAAELVNHLGCAVLAMRFPVVDAFAAGLARRFYELAAGKDQPVPRALGLALADRDVVTVPSTAECPALSIGTPALFGARAVDLRLAAPVRVTVPSFGTEFLKLAGFPAQPARFVGRTAVMAQASAVFAPRSGTPGILLYGMPGAGKTACALELAYTHEHSFERLVWFKAPDDGLDIADALNRFVLALETGLPGLQMVHLLEDEARLDGFLPSLTELFEKRRILVTIDNAESLLTEGGRWRDERWGKVVEALYDHDGLGRTILTSRRRPAAFPGQVASVPVDALSLDEALLLVRELPNLSSLTDGRAAGVDPDAARRLVLWILEVAQGHPKLLELADGVAADPVMLRGVLETASAAWQETGGLPDGFFTAGEPRADADDYLHVLAAWTAATSDGLPLPVQSLFAYLCCLEESDRRQAIVQRTWPAVAAASGLPERPGFLAEGLAALGQLSLVTVHAERRGRQELYEIHPGVAEEGRVLAGHAQRTMVDNVLAGFWTSAAIQAEEKLDGTGSSQWLVTAGLRAAPYLIRLGHYAIAESVLDAVVARDNSRSVTAVILPMLRTVTSAAAAVDEQLSSAQLLSRAQQIISPDVTERNFWELLAAALERGDYRTASGLTRDLARGYIQTGQLREALAETEKGLDYAQRAGLGPWAQLSIESQRLHVEIRMGKAESVLAEVGRMLDRASSLPAPGQNDPAHPWNVCEVLGSTGAMAALELRRWQQALDFIADVLKSKQERRASAGSIARTQLNACSALLQLGRIDEAWELALKCREIFEQDNDVRSLGAVLSVLANIERGRGHGAGAIGLAQDGLRYLYTAKDAEKIRAAHLNLAELLLRSSERPADSIAHYLAAGLIQLAQGGVQEESLEYSISFALRVSADDARLPADVTSLCGEVARVPGVTLRELLAILNPGPDSLSQMFAALLNRVNRLGPQEEINWSPFLAFFDPIIAALIAADRGNSDARDLFDFWLQGGDGLDGWSEVGKRLGRIRAGERSDGLANGLSDLHATIVRRALGAVAGQINIPAALWPAIPLGNMLMDIVASQFGDIEAAAEARSYLNHLKEFPDPGQLISFSELADVFEQILAGNYQWASRQTLRHPVSRAVVETIVNHLPRGAITAGPVPGPAS
jgi:tetratricopeptide (TPR) repeat protein